MWSLCWVLARQKTPILFSRHWEDTSHALFSADATFGSSRVFGASCCASCKDDSISGCHPNLGHPAFNQSIVFLAQLAVFAVFSFVASE